MIALRTLVLTTLLAGAALPAAADPAPRLRALLKTARVAVAGDVTAITGYDEERVAVADLTATTVFKGSLPAVPTPLAVVQIREGSTQPPLVAPSRGIAFLRPAPRTTYLQRVLPAGSYLELVPEHGAFLAARDAADADRQVAIMRRLADAARGKALTGAPARTLTFDLLASGHPVFVEDGIPGLRALGATPSLSTAELDTVRTALARTDLPDRVRIALIEAVAATQLTALVPTLQAITSPLPVKEAAWRALDALNAGPSVTALIDELGAPDADARIAAARALLRRQGAQAVGNVGALATRDPDPAVRLAVVEALGALKDPATLPPLEGAFAGDSIELRQASGRAILGVGGEPTVAALERLATSGSIDSQRYAVLLLMVSGEPSRQPVLDRIAESHPDPQTRELIEHGIDVGHKH